MSDPVSQTDEEFDHWKALQRELGLAQPTEVPRAAPPPPAPPPAAPRPAAPPATALPPAAPPPPAPAPIVAAEEVRVGLGSEGIDVTEDEEAAAETRGDDGSEQDDRRRRRRRRRRRGRGRGPADAMEPEVVADAVEHEPEVAEAPEPIVDHVVVEEAPEEVENGPADEPPPVEEPVDPEPFADWNVPSWQELIGSLYKPER